LVDRGAMRRQAHPEPTVPCLGALRRISAKSPRAAGSGVWCTPIRFKVSSCSSW
jgi:hypothetical protein